MSGDGARGVAGWMSGLGELPFVELLHDGKVGELVKVGEGFGSGNFHLRSAFWKVDRKKKGGNEYGRGEEGKSWVGRKMCRVMLRLAF